MLRLLKNLGRKEWLLVLLSVALILCQVWLELTMPDYMATITRLVQTPGSRMSEIWSSGGMMLLCAFGSLVASAATAVCSSRIATSFGYTLRRRLFTQVQAFSMGEIGRFSTASLITRSTNDVTQVQFTIVMGMQSIIRAPIMAVWAISKISTKQWEWMLSTGAAIALLLVIVLVGILVALPKFKKLQALTDNVNRITRENLTGLSVVRAYNAEGYQQQKFDNANDELTRTQLFAQRTMAFLMPGIQLVMSGLGLAIYWIGAVLINKSAMAERINLFSEMMVFSQYAIMVVMAFMMLVAIFIMLPRALVAAKRINEVLDVTPSVRDGSKTEGISGREGEIVFDRVSFSYPDAEEKVIEDISFTAKKGETLAIIGSTGCGKSTVVNLIPRFYDATDGKVLVDGVDVKEYEQKALRNKIGYISQRATLFGGTVTDNIAFGDNGRGALGAEEVSSAADTAQASEFITTMENGFDSSIAQNGANLSGGQKQRISIARAIARKPEILIFDDSFSALDYKTDKALRKALDRDCADSTRVIVAQRIGTIRDADQIIVLDEGKIVGKGRHDELMQSCAVYQQIALSQLSKEELA